MRSFKVHKVVKFVKENVFAVSADSRMKQMCEGGSDRNSGNRTLHFFSDNDLNHLK